MTRDLRWRILTLQIIVTVLFASMAGLAFYAHGYIQDQVTTQLRQQQIVFPAANSFEIKALPAADAAAMRQYAGQTMTNGDQAHVWAQSFIAVHLGIIGQGKTYNYWAGKAQAEQGTNPKQYNIDNNIALTLFRGETLRSLLLNAWAFWTGAQIALYAGFGLILAAFAVFVAFMFELVYVPRRQHAFSFKRARSRTVPAS